MALNYSKGFVYTLEAVIASALLLGVLLTVIPEFQQDADANPQLHVRSGLKTLDKTGNLTDNLSSTEIENELQNYIPGSYNHSVDIVEVETASGSFSAPDQDYIDTDGGYSELQIWIDSASGLNLSFNGNNILEDYSSTGYEHVNVDSQDGWLNFTGSGKLRYRFDTYKSDTTALDQEQVSVTNYLVLENGTKEIQVRLWN